MSWWVYKCNSKQHAYQSAWGDWRDFFEGDPDDHWGSTEWVPALAQLQRGDMIIAYQTDRNELVGLAKVRRPCERDGYLYLTPIETIGVKVRPLKEADSRIAAIPALQPGPIRTLYPISLVDAKALLRAVGSFLKVDPKSAFSAAAAALRGAGFGSADRNRQVERAAVSFVTRRYTSQGWRVRNVSSDNLGYDIECKRGKNVHHVEVKGAAGAGPQFIISANELRNWAKDRSFVLALVNCALDGPILRRFYGASGMKRFQFTPLAYVATFGGNRE